jgi:ATPase subunit of ABC transporter with duplicated ATPase domains
VSGLLLILLIVLTLIGCNERRRLRISPAPHFAPKVTFQFENINYSISKKVILENVSGDVKPGELLASK